MQLTAFVGTKIIPSQLTLHGSREAFPVKFEKLFFLFLLFFFVPIQLDKMRINGFVSVV